MKTKSFLFLMRGSPNGAEAFDLALTAAAFDQDLLLVFADDAVYWLSAGLPPLVGEAIEEIAVERESLAERGLSETLLPKGCRALSRAELGQALGEADVVVPG